MRELTIDETWDYTKRMWKWVASQKVCEDVRDTTMLKKAWLADNEPEFVDLADDCFFCDVGKSDCCDCTECPGVAVDPEFTCKGFGNPHNHYKHPAAFYREILRLDAIRTAVPPEPVVVKHEWVHGDVFSNHVWPLQMYVELFDGPAIISLEYTGHKATPDSQLRPDAEPKFLFNIKDKL